ALNEQGGGASLRLGRGGIPPTPPFRLALASDGSFFGGFGVRANFIGAPPQNLFFKQILKLASEFTFE
ncbi:MAG: hypothetical protein WCZ99_03190, partial [Candidatus Paceibacterota bacterium]